MEHSKFEMTHRIRRPKVIPRAALAPPAAKNLFHFSLQFESGLKRFILFNNTLNISLAILKENPNCVQILPNV